LVVSWVGSAVVSPVPAAAHGIGNGPAGEKQRRSGWQPGGGVWKVAGLAGAQDGAEHAPASPAGGTLGTVSLGTKWAQPRQALAGAASNGGRRCRRAAGCN